MGRGFWYMASVWRVEGVPKESVQSTEEEAKGSSTSVPSLGLLPAAAANKIEKELPWPWNGPQLHDPIPLPWQLLLLHLSMSDVYREERGKIERERDVKISRSREEEEEERCKYGWLGNYKSNKHGNSKTKESKTAWKEGEQVKVSIEGGICVIWVCLLALKK